MITKEELERLSALRQYLFKRIEDRIKEWEDGGKHYEGTFSIVFPGYYQQESFDGFQLNLDCYLIGPSRHYNWCDKTFTDVLNKAEKDIKSWS